MRQIILDTETTGLRTEDGNRILEIAAVEMVNRKLSAPDRHFHRYINPGRDSEEGALNIHGLTTDFLRDKPRFADIANEFLEFVSGAEIIIHNAPFDLGFLDKELALLGRGKFRDHVSNVIDTLADAKAMFPGKRNNLDALCDRLYVDRSARTLHGALIDCELLAEVYLAMTRGQDSLLMDFAAEDQATTRAANIIKPAIRGPLRVKLASAEECAEHEAYLDALDKGVKGLCVWRKMSAEAMAENVQ